jgi:hypothetical protein
MSEAKGVSGSSSCVRSFVCLFVFWSLGARRCPCSKRFEWLVFRCTAATINAVGFGCVLIETFGKSPRTRSPGKLKAYCVQCLQQASSEHFVLCVSSMWVRLFGGFVLRMTCWGSLGLRFQAVGATTSGAPERVWKASTAVSNRH